MNLILDTVTFLWIVADSERLSAAARLALADQDAAVFLSAVSVWEICVKYRLGKLPLPASPGGFIRGQRALRGILALPLTEDAVSRLEQLPDLHRDPFDRMLVCQAIELGMVIVTPDPQIRTYPVRTLW